MKKSKIKILFLLSAVLLALSTLIAVCLLYPNGERRETVTVPDYVGKRLSDIVPSSRFYIKSEGVYSSLPEGEIISQRPYGGAERKLAEGEKCKIELRVSLGQERNVVPELLGYHYAEAAGILREKGVYVRIVSVFDSEAANDTVIKTSPDVGQHLNAGDRVTLFVGRRRIRSSVNVGNYVGLSREDAIVNLMADGLALGDVKLVSGQSVNNGIVVGQSIKEGSIVPYGTEINITVGETEEGLHPFGRG